MRVCLFLFFALFATTLFGQAPVDSVAIVKQVDSLIQISSDLITKRDFSKALEINIAAEKSAIENLGRASAAYGRCAHNHGRVCYFKGDNGESEKWFLEAIFIREKILGKEHKDYASSLQNLGLVYMNIGNYEQAESLQLEALAIREKVQGKEHPDYATSLNNFSILYRRMGNYEKAEPLQLESLAIREKLQGKEHPDYASALNSLSILYKNMGNYEKAELLQLESLAIREKLQGKEHPDYASGLSNLSNLYRKMGNYEKAEPLQLEAFAIREKVLGKEHPDYAASLGSLAALYLVMDNYEKAEPLFLKALVIQEKTLGKDNPEYAANLCNLGGLYLNLGNYEKAESLFLESLVIRENGQGKEHPDYASDLSNLGALYGNMGNYEKGKPYYLEAFSIRKKLLGKEHPLYATCLEDLANIYFVLDDYEKVEPLLQELTLVNQSLLEKAVRHLSERELGSYLYKFSEGNDKALSFTQLSTSKKVVPSCYNNALFYKGFLLQASGQIKRQALSNPAFAEKFNLLKSYERRLAAQYTQPITKRDSAGVANLEAKVNDLEKDLARSVAVYGAAMRQVKWQEVQQKLGAGEAAVEFVRFHFSRKKQRDSTMYAALVLLPGNSQPTFILLFEEKQLETLLKASGTRKSDYVNRIYSTQKTDEKSLFQLVWQPLEETLADTKTVYFSPSGLLHRINLSAIPMSEKEYLGDRFRFVELGSTRQLVVQASSAAPSGGGEAVLWGGIQYDMDTMAIGAANESLKNDLTRTRGELGFEQTDSTSRIAFQSAGGTRGRTWAFLPWTEKEINSIASVLTVAGVKPTTRKGFAATEEAFKSIGSNAGRASNPAGVTKSPRILHIATHGYFFPDPKETTKGSASGIGAEPVFKLSDHPMIRSGLILAGGNQAWKTGKPFKPGMEDGILTAYEISQMDLSNTELVVLSACETGLGDIQGNEGVYGLQRAFKIAGAKYLIMSLWQVPDFQTQELMTTFYTNWLPSAAEAMAGKTQKQPIPDAFRAAQQAMREKYEHPYFWAGFVLVE